MTETSPIRVLVVDDERSILLSLAEFLEDYDFEVSKAFDAAQALKTLENNQYDVAIIDIRLPDISGDELIMQIHQRDPDMQFLIYTGSANFDITNKLKNLGIRPEHVFRKPLNDLTLLVKGIEKLMQEERRS